MSEWRDEVREFYRNYMAAELKRPEVQKDKEQLAAHFATKPAPLMEPAFSLAFCLLLAAFAFFFQVQQPLRQEVLPETQPVMLALTPKPVSDARKPSDLPRVMVKKVSSRVGPTMVYQRNHRDVPITIIWVFAGGHAG